MIQTIMKRNGEIVLFDASKIRGPQIADTMPVNQGQLDYEWQHLLAKLQQRNPVLYARWRDTAQPAVHPLFTVQPGDVESWERR